MDRQLELLRIQQDVCWTLHGPESVAGQQKARSDAGFGVLGSRGQARTDDPLINSQVL